MFLIPALAVRGADRFEVCGGHLTATLAPDGSLVALQDDIGQTAVTGAKEGLAILDGRSSGNTPYSIAWTKPAVRRGAVTFTGRDAAKGLTVRLRAAPLNDVLSFKATCRNESNTQQWLYVSFSLPVIAKTTAAYWDGYNEFTDIAGLEHTKRIMTGFPMSCVYGPASGVALGIEGHQLCSWLDTGIDTKDRNRFHWAAKLVLDPGQEDAVEFIAYAFPNDYGYLNAVDVYHRAFPDLFAPAPGIDPRAVYGNCASGYDCWGFVADYDQQPQRELLRRSFVTWNWMYAPFKRSGDILGREAFWNWGNTVADENPNFKGTAKDFREKLRPPGFARADKYNVLPMFYAINWAEERLANEVYAGSRIHDPNGCDRLDPWVHGFLCSVRMYMWGNKFAEATLADQRTLLQEPLRGLGGFSIDCAGGEECHRGDGLNQSPGRAYDKTGVFVSEGIGQARWFDAMHGLKKGERTMAIVANGGDAHYLTAFRTDTAIGECSAMNYLTNPKAAEAGQLLMGRKPRCLYQINYYTDQIGEQVDWKTMTPAQIRDVYRALFKSYVLLGFKNNFFYSADLAVGSKHILRSMPAQLELSRAGWQAVPACRAGSGLWLARYGTGPDTYLFLGNPSTDAKQGQAIVDSRYLGDAKYVFTTFDGQETANTVTPRHTLLDYGIEPKEYVIFKCALALKTKGEFRAIVSERTTCDQSLVKAVLRDLTAPGGATARVPRDMTPVAVTQDGKPVRFKAAADVVAFAIKPARQTTIEIRFNSKHVLSPEKQILDLPIYSVAKQPVCKVALGSQATEYDKEIGWWIQDYFKVYCRAVENFAIGIPISTFTNLTERSNLIVIGGDEILPDLNAIEAGAGTALATRPGGAIKLIGDNVLVVYAKDGLERRAMVDRLLRIWDKKYVYYGGLTVPGVPGLGVEPQSVATREMRKKAGIVGRVVDDDESAYAPVMPRAFVVDDQTLFLAHFDRDLAADTAKGAAAPLHGHAGITAKRGGRFGEALVCRTGLIAGPNGVSAPFLQPGYGADGNVDLGQGTIELWIKLDFARKPTAEKPLSLYYFLDLPSKSLDENKNLKRLCLVMTHYLDKNSGAIRKQLNYYAHDRTNMVTIVTPADNWSADEWHHVAITWDNAETVLFVDGVKAGTAALKGGLYGGDRGVLQDLFVIGGLWSGSGEQNPECVIDEFRISNMVRHLENFTP
ncbi:MAG: LamG domain-containing protein [Kiritimatiellae bacterium]|nr:LamG domain-containing protein [Kiritimatiellia bacterium]